ncbi:MAG: hypothetical protein BWY59_00285 [Verrucomicrobia bacterium ADurb.Bin345]|nr:MAG: hypothetical protein BWY59_00285 [Verrucomicrobia bacterium ADurb.Bin345]
MARRRVEAHVRGGRDLQQPDPQNALAVGRNIQVGQPPFIRIIAGNAQAGRHLVRAHPGRLPQRVGPVAVRLPRLRVVIGRIAVGKVVEHLRHGRIGPHHHAVLVLPVGFARRRILDLALRRFGVQVERLRERVVERRAAVALQERARADHVETVHQARRNHAPVVVRTIHDAAGVDVRHLPRAHHLHLEPDLVSTDRERAVPRHSVGALQTVAADLEAERHTVREALDRRRPPGWRSTTVRSAVRVPTHLRDLCRAARLAARALGPRSIRRVIHAQPVDQILVADLHAQRDLRGDAGGRGRHLRIARLVVRHRIEVDPGRGLRAVPVVRAVGEIRCDAAADRHHVGFRAGGADLVPGGVHRRELLRPDAADERGLLVTKIHVVGSLVARRIIARVATGPVVDAVEVHAAVQLHQDVDRRPVHVRNEFQVGGRRHPRNKPRVRVRRALGVRHAVGIEVRVAVGTVAARVAHPSRLGAVSIVDRDGLAAAPAPQVGLLRRAPRENEVAARRHDHVVQLGRVGVEPAAVAGVVVQISVAPAARVREADVRADVPRRAACVVVVDQHQHRAAVGIGHASVRALVYALVGKVIAVRPDPSLPAARELVVRVDKPRNPVVAPLPEIGRVRVARERAAALAERLRLAIAVRVDHGQPGARQVDDVVKFLAVRDVVIVALRVVYAERRAHLHAGNVVRRIQPCERAPRIPKFVVQRRMRARVEQPHAGRPVVAVARRLAHVLAEHHRVVAPV